MLDIDHHRHRKLQQLSGAPRGRHHQSPGARKITHLPSALSFRTANAYNHVGPNYARYADGAPGGNAPQAAPYRFAQADSIVWEAVQSALDSLRSAGASRVRILDAGCGPGGWSKKIAEYCLSVGLSAEIVGVDISTHQLEFARRDSAEWLRRYQTQTKVSLQFQEQDLSRRLPWADGYFHLTLCNYTVLNHLAESVLSSAIAELCRVTEESVIATLRAVGSQPTACIIGMEHVREYQHDQKRGRLALSLDDGSQHQLPFKLYAAQELERLFSPHSSIQDLRAIDIFMSRFAPDAHWTSLLLEALPTRSLLVDKLKEMEEALCRLPGWVDHGTHVLIVTKPKPNGPVTTTAAPAVAETPAVASFADYLAKSR
jgi:SAM-dependent methyltransferase